LPRKAKFGSVRDRAAPRLADGGGACANVAFVTGAVPGDGSLCAPAFSLARARSACPLVFKAYATVSGGAARDIHSAGRPAKTRCSGVEVSTIAHAYLALAAGCCVSHAAPAGHAQAHARCLAAVAPADMLRSAAVRRHALTGVNAAPKLANAQPFCRGFKAQTQLIVGTAEFAGTVPVFAAPGLACADAACAHDAGIAGAVTAAFGRVVQPAPGLAAALVANITCAAAFVPAAPSLAEAQKAVLGTFANIALLAAALAVAVDTAPGLAGFGSVGLCAGYACAQIVADTVLVLAARGLANLVDAGMAFVTVLLRSAPGFAKAAHANIACAAVAILAARKHFGLLAFLLPRFKGDGSRAGNADGPNGPKPQAPWLSYVHAFSP